MGMKGKMLFSTENSTYESCNYDLWWSCKQSSLESIRKVFKKYSKKETTPAVFSKLHKSKFPQITKASYHFLKISMLSR